MLNEDERNDIIKQVNLAVDVKIIYNQLSEFSSPVLLLEKNMPRQQSRKMYHQTSSNSHTT